MRRLLSRMGFGQANVAEEADLILLVTCSIREKAADKVYSELGRIRPYTEENPGLITGVAGCLAQQEKGKLFQRFPFLDLVFGPDAIKELPHMVREVWEKKKVGLRPHHLNTHFNQKKDFEFVNLIVDGEENRVRALVNIQKGCDNVCSFCVVPRVRGPEVSRPSREIIDEIKAVTDMGVKEVTLLGQNVNSYGLKDTGEVTFARLLQRIAEETTLKRLRFMTSHPQDVGEDLIEQFRDNPVLLPHFHLPVQSGSNRVLKAMRRHYSREYYLRLVESLRKARGDLCLTTDFIIGFPGEGEKDFYETIDLLNAVNFDASYSFIYSPRPGTTAARQPDTFSQDEKVRRLEILLNRQREISLIKNQRLQGVLQEVLVESHHPLEHNGMGRTGTNKIVHFTLPKGGPDEYVGQLVPVRIIKANPNSLEGEALARG